MKFLCVECDQAMTLLETRGPDRGSMTVVFGCPECGRRMAMLTNSMETKMVASLGVTIGPGTRGEEAPMPGLRSSLVGYPGGGEESAVGTSGTRKSGCPFTEIVNEASDELRWTEGARSRMERIPSFVRPMVERGIEDVARRDGFDVVDEEVIARVRSEFGM